MAPLSSDAWLLVGVVALVCMLSFGYALATLYRDQTMLHDLKVRVHRLRREYAVRLARQLAEEVIEAEVVSDAQPETGAETAPRERSRAAA